MVSWYVLLLFLNKEDITYFSYLPSKSTNKHSTNCNNSCDSYTSDNSWQVTHYNLPSTCPGFCICRTSTSNVLCSVYRFISLHWNICSNTVFLTASSLAVPPPTKSLVLQASNNPFPFHSNFVSTLQRPIFNPVLIYFSSFCYCNVNLETLSKGICLSLIANYTW